MKAFYRRALMKALWNFNSYFVINFLMIPVSFKIPLQKHKRNLFLMTVVS